MKDCNDELYSNKSNQMIQNYAWNLKEKQLKIMELLCSCYMTNYYDAEKNTVTIGLAELMKELGSTTKGVNAKEYAVFRDSLKRLSDFSIIGIGFNGRERLIRMINTFEYLPDTSQIKCFMSDDYRESMKLQDRGNTKIEFRTVYSMNSRFSIKLYNLLRSWQGKKEVYFDLDYLKELLNVTAKSYDNFAKFRQAVLDVAVDEINEKTKLRVSYEGIGVKRGRGQKVTKVVFRISEVKPIEGTAKELPDAEPKQDKEKPDTLRFFDANGNPVYMSAKKLMQATEKINRLLASGVKLTEEQFRALMQEAYLEEDVSPAPEPELPGQMDIEDYLDEPSEDYSRNPMEITFASDTEKRKYVEGYLNVHFKEKENHEYCLDVVPEEVHRYEEANVEAIKSVANQYIKLEHQPLGQDLLKSNAEHKKLMREAVEAYTSEKWIPRHSKMVKNDATSYFTSCFGYWLMDNSERFLPDVEEPAKSYDEDEFFNAAVAKTQRKRAARN